MRRFFFTSDTFDISCLVYSNFSTKIISKYSNRACVDFKYFFVLNLNKLKRKYHMHPKSKHSDKKYAFVIYECSR